jgi:uncharacterized membrane protein
MNKTGAEKRRVCQVCGSDRPSDLHRGILAGPAVAEVIRRATGSWSDEGWICTNDLNRYRHEYVKSLLEADRGELTPLDERVLESLRQQEVLSRNPEEDRQSGLTVGQRVADRVATFGGSWTFLALFAVVLILWIAVNSVVLISRPFDPYPFILLNLVLSVLAAIQAPLIMMSQIRQESRDRVHATHDYQVNLKAELEIRHLNEKFDYLLSHQLERLVEIQEMQMKMIKEQRGRSRDSYRG